MIASESHVVVRNGFLEVVGCAEQRRPRAQTDCPVGSKIRVFPTDSITHISVRLKAEETSCQVISEASTETAGSQGQASAPLTARSNSSSDAAGRPRLETAEPWHTGMTFEPAFHDVTSLLPVYQGEPWAAPTYGTQVSPIESQMQQVRAQEHYYVQPSFHLYYAALSSAAVPAHAQPNWTASTAPQAAPTTLMLRNLPVEYDRTMLLELFDSEGFAGLYDFVYLPADFRKSGCFGYCFINFVTPAAAEGFRQHFQGFSRWAFLSDRMAEVSVSDPLQGLEAHIERYRDSPLMHESVPDVYKPVLLANGERIAFPPPTKKLKAPRMRAAKGPQAA